MRGLRTRLMTGSAVVGAAMAASVALAPSASAGVAFVCADMGGGDLRWAHRVDTLE